MNLKCNLITGITDNNHKLKVKYAIVFLFLLGSTLSISVSPILAASDIDDDGVLDDIDSCPRLQEDYFGDIDGCPSKNLNWLDSDNVQVAPQETEITSYLVSAIDNTIDSEDEDFSYFKLLVLSIKCSKLMSIILREKQSRSMSMEKILYSLNLRQTTS